MFYEPLRIPAAKNFQRLEKRTFRTSNDWNIWQAMLDHPRQSEQIEYSMTVALKIGGTGERSA